MRDWEKLARACRRYLDAYNDEIADDITLGSVGNDLRIIAIREVQAAPRVFFPGDTVPADVGVMDETGGGGRRFSWDWVADYVYVETWIPNRAEWQSTVDRARAEREAKHDG